MDGGAWWAAVQGVAKSRTRLSNFTFTVHFHALEKEMATHSSVLARRTENALLFFSNVSLRQLKALFLLPELELKWQNNTCVTKHRSTAVQSEGCPEDVATEVQSRKCKSSGEGLSCSELMKICSCRLSANVYSCVPWSRWWYRWFFI